MYNDTSLNILVSYAYCGQQKAFIDRLVSLSSSGTINLMFDSGAFTRFNARGNHNHINVDAYCDFLKSYGKYAEKYVMLDVIGNADASRENYEKMLAQGLNPMFVATMFDKDYNYIRQAVNNNPDICVAGGATTKGDWMTNRFIEIYNQTNGKAKIHGLAYVTFPRMLQLPLASVDSASWKLGALRFGSMFFFRTGLKGVFYKDVLIGKKKFNISQIKTLNELGITPSEFRNEGNHKGNKSIAILSSIKANIEMQKYCKYRGLNFFLSASNLQDLDKIVYVATSKNITYKEFKTI